MSNSISETLTINPLPAIPGLTFRPFAGASDYPHIAAIINASAKAEGLDYTSTVEDVAQNYEHLTNCDPATDIVMVEVDRHTIGYNRVTWWQEENGPRVFATIGYVHPEWQRKGIGRALMEWAKQRHRAIAATQNYAGEKFAQLWITGTAVALQALARDLGYAPIRYAFDMVRPDLDNLPDYKLPAGIEIRPVTPDQYRAIWDADVEAFRDHWGFSEPTEEDYRRWLDFPYFDPSLWTIAWDGDQVAGQVKSFINATENAEFNRKRGYTENISVRRPWRKRGVARALIVESFKILKARGMTEAALGVDAENPNGALRVYEDCGFRVVRRSATWRKPLF